MNIGLHGWTPHHRLDGNAFRGDILPSGSLRRDRGARRGRLRRGRRRRFPRRLRPAEAHRAASRLP